MSVVRACTLHPDRKEPLFDLLRMWLQLRTHVGAGAVQMLCACMCWRCMSSVHWPHNVMMCSALCAACFAR